MRKIFSTVHTITATDTTIHGIQPCPPETGACVSARRSTLTSNLSSATGFHTRRNAIVRINEMSEASTSVSA